MITQSLTASKHIQSDNRINSAITQQRNRTTASLKTLQRVSHS